MIRTLRCVFVSILAGAAFFGATVLATQDTPPGYLEVLPSAIVWQPSPVPGLHVANLLGSPPEPGPFVIRVKLLPGAKVMPHTHIFYRLPAAVSHFHAAGAAETIVQIDSVGPSAMEFISHDPRKQ